jgi:YD repeat-containing protein
MLGRSRTLFDSLARASSPQRALQARFLSPTPRRTASMQSASQTLTSVFRCRSIAVPTSTGPQKPRASRLVAPRWRSAHADRGTVTVHVAWVFASLLGTSTICVAAPVHYCTQLVQGAVPGDDPTVADFGCDLQQCATCPVPDQSFLNSYGPFDVVAASDLTTGNPTSTLTILPNGISVPIDPTGNERLVAVYFVWDWPIAYAGAENRLSLDLSVTAPGDQVWLSYQYLPTYELPACVSFGTHGVDYVRSTGGDPLRVDGCAPLPRAAGSTSGIGWRVFMPRMERQNAPWMALLQQLNRGVLAIPENPRDLEITATELPAGAVLQSGTVPAKVYFFTRMNPMWGNIIPTAPTFDFESVSGNKTGLIYLDNNDDSGVPGVLDQNEVPDPNGRNKFLHFQNTIPQPIAANVMMLSMQDLTDEFPYLNQIDRQLTPIVLDMPINWVSNLGSGGAKLSFAAGSGAARMWLVNDIDGDGKYDEVVQQPMPLEYGFPADISNFCKLVGRPFMNENGCKTPGMGWGEPMGLMVEAIGGLNEQITLILETSTDRVSWQLRDKVVLQTVGFGFLVNGSTGPFETLPLGGYEIPTLGQLASTQQPEPPNLEDRLVPARIETPVAFLQLNSNPIAGFYLAPGHQWVVKRVPKDPDDPLPSSPLYVTIDSFQDGHWPGFSTGFGSGETPGRAYFQLVVQNDMAITAWDSLTQNLFIAHWPNDPRLFSNPLQTCSSGPSVAGVSIPPPGCNCSTGVTVATGMCGAAMGDTCSPDCGDCKKSGQDDCKDPDPPCKNSGSSSGDSEDQYQCKEDPCSSAGDPVHLYSGEFFFDEVDLRIPGRGRDFVWERRYRSKVSPNTVQGNGWDFTYGIYLEQIGQGRSNLVLFDGHSRSDIYFDQGNGTWATRGFFRTIVFNPDSESCVGDITGDNVVNAGDLAALLANWGCTGTCSSDRNGDGIVNVIDLFLVLADWGDCPAVPAYVLTFADRAQWTFFPFDGSPSAGKLKSQIDRNGNTTSFLYDSQGRVDTVIDTLNREIKLAYNTDGFLASVTDFTGRQVRYDYYHDGDAGGGRGDLKSVTTPAVVGTPNGNDFPAG